MCPSICVFIYKCIYVFVSSHTVCLQLSRAGTTKQRVHVLHIQLRGWSNCCRQFLNTKEMMTTQQGHTQRGCCDALLTGPKHRGRAKRDDALVKDWPTRFITLPSSENEHIYMFSKWALALQYPARGVHHTLWHPFSHHQKSRQWKSCKNIVCSDVIYSTLKSQFPCWHCHFINHLLKFSLLTISKTKCKEQTTHFVLTTCPHPQIKQYVCVGMTVPIFPVWVACDTLL